MSNSLIRLLQEISPLSGELQGELGRCLLKEKLPRKHLLLEPGQTAKTIYYINRGFARAYYYTKDGRECTNRFMAQGDFIVSGNSFYNQQPAEEFVELLEDSELLSITRNQLYALYNKFPEFNYTGRVITEKYLMQAGKRVAMLRIMRALDRYEILLQNCPGILNKASLGQIASYLGIKQETLSRVRGRIVKPR